MAHDIEFWVGPIGSWSVGYYAGCRGEFFVSEDPEFREGWAQGYAQHLVEATVNMRRLLDGSKEERAPKSP